MEIAFATTREQEYGPDRLPPTGVLATRQVANEWDKVTEPHLLIEERARAESKGLVVIKQRTASGQEASKPAAAEQSTARPPCQNWTPLEPDVSTNAGLSSFVALTRLLSVPQRRPFTGYSVAPVLSPGAARRATQ